MRFKLPVKVIMKEVSFILNAEVNDVMEDENDEEEDPEESLLDDEDKEEDPKKKKKAKYVPLFGAHVYCACKKPTKKRDPMEDSKDESISDHIDEITQDVEFSDPKSKKEKFKAFLNKLVKPYFGAVNLKCYCTKNRAVVRYTHLLL